MTIWQFAIARAARQLADKINRGENLSPAECEAAHLTFDWTMKHPSYEAVPHSAIRAAAASDELWRGRQ